jgi:hypothetical protein
VTIHDFDERLAYSHKQADQPWWEQVYRKAFPDQLKIIDLRHDGWHQRAGRDRAVVLSSGQTIYIDEKARDRRDRRDIAVEIWSIYPKGGEEPYPPVDGRSVPGWARKTLGCDWLAYAFVPSRICYLFPFLGIRAAWEKNWCDWINKATRREAGFDWIVAPNKDYDTICIAVPTQFLNEAIQDAMTITWKAAA